MIKWNRLSAAIVAIALISFCNYYFSISSIPLLTKIDEKAEILQEIMVRNGVDFWKDQKEGLGNVLDPVVGNHVQKSIPPYIEAQSVGNFNGCIVSDRLRFIYIKTAKSAGSTILLGWLRPSLCPAKNKSDTFTGWEIHEEDNISKSCSTSIVYPPPGTDTSPCSEIPLWKWEQYFVFTTIRNPYSRMRSSYKYCKSELSWEEFCQDPKLTNGCRQKGSKNPFNRHLFNSHYQFPIHWAYHGWHGWHVDYIIRVEAIDEGIEEVAKIVNGRAMLQGETLRLSEKSLRTVNRKNNTTSMEKEELCKWYTGKNTKCAVALEKTLDPRVLGYENYCKISLT